MKKNNITTTINNETVEAIANEMRIQMELHPEVSLRKISQATGMNYQTVLKASKKPTPGVEYNPDEVNYMEVSKYVARKEEWVEAFKEIDWLTLAVHSQSGRVSTLVKDINDPMFNVGQRVYLRTNPTVPYEILYKTGTHIVIMLEGTEEPISWSHSTFFFKGPQSEPRTVRVESDEMVAEEE